jgi:hypothetical protein
MGLAQNRVHLWIACAKEDWNCSRENGEVKARLCVDSRYGVFALLAAAIPF